MSLVENEAKTVDTNIQDIDLSVTSKKKFRIDGDNTRILALNPSDMGIITRLNSIYPKLEKIAQDAAVEVDGESDDEVLDKTAKQVETFDKKMRALMDELFDSNVSEICAPDGTMLDPFNGQYRFEHIIEVLSKLYENNMSEEFKRVQTKSKMHTAKYTKKK